MRLGLHLIAICLLAAALAARISEPPLLAAPSSEQSSSSQAAATTSSQAAAGAPAAGYAGSDTCETQGHSRDKSRHPERDARLAGEEPALAGPSSPPTGARAATVRVRRTSTTT